MNKLDAAITETLAELVKMPNEEFTRLIKMAVEGTDEAEETKEQFPMLDTVTMLRES